VFASTGSYKEPLLVGWYQEQERVLIFPFQFGISLSIGQQVPRTRTCLNISGSYKEQFVIDISISIGYQASTIINSLLRHYTSHYYYCYQPVTTTTATSHYYYGYQ
jgi:hypothetical protein